MHNLGFEPESDNDICKPTIVDLPEEKSQAERKRRNLTSIITWSIVLLLLLAYFVWATVYFIKHTEETLDSTTCNGYGFLMIIYIFIIYSVLYKIVLKPFVSPTVKKILWRPLVGSFSHIKYIPYIFCGLIIIASALFLGWDTSGDRTRLIPLTGLATFIALGYLCSHNRKKIPWLTVCSGLILQFLFGVLTIRWEVGRNIFKCIGDKVTVFLGYAKEGSAFVYGDYLTYELGVFAFASLATIFLLGFIVNLLYHYGIMQKIVIGIGGFLGAIMGTTICESMNTAANIFLGQSESPLLLKPYLKDLTTSEIHTIMAGGFATVAGSVMAAYISFGASATHLITASIMSAPSALCCSKLVWPEDEEVKSTKASIKACKSEYHSAMDAASRGAIDAMTLVLGIIASLMAVLSVLAMVNGVLAFLGTLVGFTGDSEWSVQLILGKVLIPVSWIIGIPWDECEQVGRLIGIKTMVNEFVAFQQMQNMTLTNRTKVLTTYAICGFANPGSISIMVSAMYTLMPNKRGAINKVVFRSFLVGVVVCLMTACFAGLLISSEDINI